MIKLEKGEKIDIIVHKHWFVYCADIFSVAIFLFLPIFIAVLFKLLDKYVIEIGGSIVGLYLVVSALFLLFAWTFIFVIWTDHYLDVLVLTNKHIIDVEQKGLFSRELSTFRLDKIQDVTAETNGIIPTFLKFGTIHVQTAGEDRDFLIRGIPKPFEIRQIISKQQSTAMDKLQTMHISKDSLKKMSSLYDKSQTKNNV